MATFLGATMVQDKESNKMAVLVTGGAIMFLGTVGLTALTAIGKKYEREQRSEQAKKEAISSLAIHRANPDRALLTKVAISIPKELENVDFSNEEAVANALRIKLSPNDSKQHLFTMHLITGAELERLFPNDDSFVRDLNFDKIPPENRATVEITRENLKEVANLIKEMQQPFMKKWEKLMYPGNDKAATTQPAGGKSRS